MLVKDKIRENRKEMGLSSAALAAMVGVSPANMSRYEHGYILTIPDHVLQKLSDVFDCTVEDLVKDDPAYKHLQKNKPSRKKESISGNDRIILQWFHTMPYEVQTFLISKAKQDMENAVDQ